MLVSDVHVPAWVHAAVDHTRTVTIARITLSFLMLYPPFCLFVVFRLVSLSSCRRASGRTRVILVPLLPAGQRPSWARGHSPAAMSWRARMKALPQNGSPNARSAASSGDTADPVRQPLGYKPLHLKRLGVEEWCSCERSPLLGELLSQAGILCQGKKSPKKDGGKAGHLNLHSQPRLCLAQSSVRHDHTGWRSLGHASGPKRPRSQPSALQPFSPHARVCRVGAGRRSVL